MEQKKASLLDRTVRRLRGRGSRPPEDLASALASEEWRSAFAFWCVGAGVELERMLNFFEEVDDYRAAPSWVSFDAIMRRYVATGAQMPIEVEDWRCDAILAAAAASGRTQPPSARLLDSTRESVYVALSKQYLNYWGGVAV